MTPEKYGSEFPSPAYKKHIRPPVKSEEGYGLYMWLCEQDMPDNDIEDQS
jgi:hypothetical protein